MTRCEKLSFALGALVNALSVCTVGFYLNPFLLEIAQVSPSFVSIVMFVGRGWDAITTALAGMAVQRFPSIKGWLFATCVPTSVAYFFIWIVWDLSKTGKAVYAFSMYLLYQMGTSFYQVPYTALTVRMHADPAQRDMATTWRMITEIGSVLIGAGLQGIILASFTKGTQCSSCDKTDGGNSEAKKGYIWSAVVMTAIMVIGGTVCPLGVKERVKQALRKPGEGGTDSGGAVKSVFRSRSFCTLTAAFFFIWLTVQGVQGNILLYAKYAVPSWNDKFQYLLFAFVFCATIGMPIWMIIMKKIGKKRAYLIGSTTLGLLLHGLYWIPDDTNVYLGMGLCVLCGLALSATYLLPWSMIPAVVDEAELVTGRRDEAIFYAFFVFFMKMGAGIALSGSALALQFAGWVDPCCQRTDLQVPCDCAVPTTCKCDVQPAAVGHALRIVVGIAGPGLIFLGIICIMMFPITPEKEEAIAAQMEEKRKAAPRASTHARHSVAGVYSRNSVAVPATFSGPAFAPPASPVSNRNSAPAGVGNPLSMLNERQRPKSMGLPTRS